MNVDLIDTIVSQYLKVFPQERGNLAGLIEQIVNEDDLNNRKTLPGHVTGSAFVLSPDRTSILMLEHKYLKLWVQPGGHWEPEDANPWEAAWREAEEETGVKIAEQVAWGDHDPSLPLDIEVQEIPANPEKDELDHYHYDFRYVFIASSTELAAGAEYESAQWFDFDMLPREDWERVVSKLRTYGII